MNCRICDSACFDKALLAYSGMPSSAQSFPELGDLKDDIGSNLDVFQCSSCGLVQLNNIPVSYYKEVIRASAFSEEMRGFRRIQFEDWIKQYSLVGKKILEIGCGRGEYLSILGKSDVLVHGVEYSEKAVEACREQGYSVTKGFFGDSDLILPEQKYDGFVCLSFMEHWPDPNKVLAHLSGCLVGNAVGLIEVPNFNMILEQRLFSEFISDHLMYFTQDTLTFALQLNGFEVVECSPVWHDYIISAVVKKRSRIDLTSFESQRLKLMKDLNEFIDRFGLDRVAVWGAGHQALAVLSLASIGKRIKYVVDSAPFKQGKYTPATHIPILAPSQLINDPVDAIIIMAGSYSEEVVKIVRDNSSGEMKVAILRDYGLEIT
tara:strand:+ start:586 stop:1713 length:1128 start_codon:yes stop_codon:yes gene_type:complete